jgi:NAD(P)-dependent dehydrogenase (short-subunit alcohol dehydrogenase family)
MKLKDKVTIITGGSSGIGKAMAILFAKEGAKVVIASRDEKVGKVVADEAGGIFLKTDVTKAKDIANLINKTVGEFGRLDIMVNNAGVYWPDFLEEAEDEKISKTVNVNLTGALLGSKYAVQQMKKQNGGVILSTSSSLGIVADVEAVPYCAAKAGVIHMTRALALETSKYNIRVNCILPGPIDAPMLHSAIPDQKELEDYRNLVPMKRFGTPEEVAKVALTLVSDDASYVTGAAWTVDGGEAAR